MDVVLGVAVTDRVASLALVGPAAQGQDVIDHSVVELADHPVETLTETVVGTNRLLAGENHRLIATRLCWSDLGKADELLRALDDCGVEDVEVLSESQAAAALRMGQPGFAVLLVGDETAVLSEVGVSDQDAPPTLLGSGALEATVDTVLARLGDQAGTARDVLLVGASAERTTDLADQLGADSTRRVEIADDPTFALARGAAMVAAAHTSAMVATSSQAALSDGEATMYMPPVEVTPSNPEEDSQLAYSQAGDQELLPIEPMGEDQQEAGPARLTRRSLLIGNVVVAFAVIGFASLAVAVAITIRPTAASEPVQGHQNAQPGKFLPLLPTEQQAPVPPPPLDDPTAGFQGGTVPAVQRAVPRQVGGPPAAPAPEPPAAPGIVPVPVPIIIAPPGWRPLVPIPPAPTNLPTVPVITPTTTVPVTTTPPAPPTTTVPTTPHSTPTTATPSTTPATPTTPHTTVNSPATTITQTTVASKPPPHTPESMPPTPQISIAQSPKPPRPAAPKPPQPAAPKPSSGSGGHSSTGS